MIAANKNCPGHSPTQRQQHNNRRDAAIAALKPPACMPGTNLIGEITTKQPLLWPFRARLSSQLLSISLIELISVLSFGEAIGPAQR